MHQKLGLKSLVQTTRLSWLSNLAYPASLPFVQKPWLPIPGKPGYYVNQVIKAKELFSFVDGKEKRKETKERPKKRGQHKPTRKAQV